MKHVMAKFVPRVLLPEQKGHHVAVANDLIQIATNEPDFLKKIITKIQIMGLWLGSRNKDPVITKKVCQSCSKIETMLNMFFDWEGVVYHEYVPLRPKN